MLKPRIYVPTRFSTGIKYRPADFEENVDTLEVPVKYPMIHGRAPIVINNADWNLKLSIKFRTNFV